MSNIGRHINVSKFFFFHSLCIYAVDRLQNSRWRYLMIRFRLPRRFGKVKYVEQFLTFRYNSNKRELFLSFLEFVLNTV